MSKIWICCAHCGSRDVTRDAIARWSDEAQCWEVSSELDNSDCETCGEERDLEEVEIVPDCEIPAAIAEFGWVTIDTSDAKEPYGIVGAPTTFETLADAYCWARANDRT